MADVLDAFGFDRILLETVGVGQSELDIARAAESTLVVLVPESGDSIQTLKAGLMEIADLFAVNKADRPGADRVRNDIELMLGMRSGLALTHATAHHGVDLGTINNPGRAARAAATGEQEEHWVPPVLRTVASKGEGIAELIDALDRHFRYLGASGELTTRRRARWREQILEVAEQRLRIRVWGDAEIRAFIDASGAGDSASVRSRRVSGCIAAPSASLRSDGPSGCGAYSSHRPPTVRCETRRFDHARSSSTKSRRASAALESANSVGAPEGAKSRSSGFVVVYGATRASRRSSRRRSRTSRQEPARRLASPTSCCGAVPAS